MSEGMIKIDEFGRVDMRVGLVVEAEAVAGSEKLIRCRVEVGETEPRVIFAGLTRWYEPEELVGQQVVVVVNLEPRRIMGEESQGMILAAADENGKPILLVPQDEAAVGSRVK